MTKRYDPTLTMRIPAPELARLKALAKSRGMTTAALARSILMQQMAGTLMGAWNIVSEMLEHDDLRRALSSLLEARTAAQLTRARRVAQKAIAKRDNM